MLNYFKSFLPKFRHNDDQSPDSKFTNEEVERKEENINVISGENIQRTEENLVNAAPIYSHNQQKNYYEGNFKLLIDQGNYGINLFNQKKYKESKEILIKVCDELFKFYKKNPNNGIKEYVLKFIKCSEECQKALKGDKNSADPIMNMIKETILEKGQTTIKFEDISFFFYL